MLQFQNDYNEGAHPRILQRLVETNFLQTVGYGEDEFCDRARRTIRRLCQCPDAEVQFLVGGTQTNTTVISAALRPHQGVVAPDTGHINVHETGAIESTGHKVIALPAHEGKITAAQVAECVAQHNADEAFEHMVQPGMVYISFPTEIGTLYSRDELEALSTVCRKRGLPLFIDGARLGYGLAAPDCDITLPELAQWADVFYIGGTKVGALFGEAVVITSKALRRDFRYLIKQRGGMLAKGRLLGVQFDTLFSGNLYFDIAERAVQQALRIRDTLRKWGVDFLVESPTNQQFPILPDAVIERLSHNFLLSSWQRIDATRSAVRICTSWATADTAVDALLAALDAALHSAD